MTSALRTKQDSRISSDTRQTPRVTGVRIPASVSDGEITIPCTLRNFSRGGCLLRAPAIEHIGSEIKLKIEGIDGALSGRVAWRKPGTLGVEFKWSDPTDGEGLRKRREPRKPVRLSAEIIPGKGLPVIPCEIIDVSRRGCRLRSVHADKLPDDVRLGVPSLGLSIAGHIRWRQDDNAGIEFDWQKAEPFV